jgi:hypothetical protein
VGFWGKIKLGRGKLSQVQENLWGTQSQKRFTEGHEGNEGKTILAQSRQDQRKPDDGRQMTDGSKKPEDR